MSEYRPLRSSAQANEEQEERDAHAGGSASVFSCIANLANTILGTGMLAMPSAISAGGIFPGAFTILFSGCAAALGLHLLSKSAARLGRNSSFSALSAITLPSLRILFDTAIALKCFGVSISYLIIIAGLCPKVVLSFADSPDNVPHFLLERGFWITVSICTLTPICFLRKLNAFRYLSYFALVVVADLLVVVIYKFFDRSGLEPRGHVDLVHVSPALVSSLPIYIFAFTCAQNLFSIHNELIDNTPARMDKVVATAIFGSGVIYEVIGLLGYLTFGNTVSSNVLESYHHSLLIAICRAGITIFVLFSYPLQLHPCRAALHQILRVSKAKAQAALDDPDVSKNPHDGLPEEDETDESLFQYIALTCGILVASFIIALSIQSLEMVLGFVGSTGSTTISFILPAIFYLKLFSQERSRKESILRVLAWALLFYGFTVMIVCLSLNTYEAIKSTHRVTRGKHHSDAPHH